jgi:hypothetical protein
MRGRRGPPDSARWGFEAVEVEVGGRACDSDFATDNGTNYLP